MECFCNSDQFFFDSTLNIVSTAVEKTSTQAAYFYILTQNYILPSFWKEKTFVQFK